MATNFLVVIVLIVVPQRDLNPKELASWHTNANLELGLLPPLCWIRVLISFYAECFNNRQGVRVHVHSIPSG